MSAQTRKIALLGNPNCGKTSIFNQLTGLHQKVGNFAGVTTARHSGFFRYNGQRYELVDLPGTYSLYARAEDEQVVLQALLGEEEFFTLVLVVDANNIRRSMLLLTQLQDLELPVVVVLNMIDEAFKVGLRIDTDFLSLRLQLPVVATNARSSEGVEELREVLGQQRPSKGVPFLPEVELPYLEAVSEVRKMFSLPNAYWAHLCLQQGTKLQLPNSDKLRQIMAYYNYSPLKAQREELDRRQKYLDSKLHMLLPTDSQKRFRLTDKVDKILTHGIYGTLVFVLMLLIIFQAIFAWSEPMMETIDTTFGWIRGSLTALLPQSTWTDLLTSGLLVGMSGVIIFVPQIAFLFLLIGLLEESGYMSRVVTLADRMMRRFGLDGRSIIPLISGMGCAIPAVMATRGIVGRRERLLTILVVPLMSCSARLPVYTMLIALVFTSSVSWGPFNPQGLILLGMYLLGVVAALGMSTLLRLMLPRSTSSFLIIELPPYRWPLLRNVWIAVYKKVRSFVLEAGKVILSISIILWILASYGGSTDYEYELRQRQSQGELLSEQAQASLRLKHSYMGQLGRAVEPLIAPLGYDWKIGIALIGSFAAREVFVSTLAVVYSLGDTEESKGLQQRLRQEKNKSTGEPVFGLAVCVSLLLFYAFAMQCMSTLAVVYRETRSWRWPLLQLLYMSTLAYAAAWTAYALLS